MIYRPAVDVKVRSLLFAEMSVARHESEYHKFVILLFPKAKFDANLAAIQYAKSMDSLIDENNTLSASRLQH
jgi:hypothetical protein